MLSYDHFLNCCASCSCLIICISWSKEQWNGSYALSYLCSCSKQPLSGHKVSPPNSWVLLYQPSASPFPLAVIVEAESCRPHLKMANKQTHSTWYLEKRVHLSFCCHAARRAWGQQPLLCKALLAGGIVRSPTYAPGAACTSQYIRTHQGTENQEWYGHALLPPWHKLKNNESKQDTKNKINLSVTTASLLARTDDWVAMLIFADSGPEKRWDTNWSLINERCLYILKQVRPPHQLRAIFYLG